jgi:hypothetical protein
MADSAAMDAMAEIAQSSADPALRKTAIQELGRSYGSNARGHLDRLLNAPGEETRKAAAKALRRIQETGGAGPAPHSR